MPALDDILANVPVDDLAQQLDSDPESVRAAAAAVVPALLGGLNENAQDPAGAASIAEALGQHADRDASSVSTEEGAKIARHIFGDNQEQVVAQLGGVGGASSGLIQKLIPILAPIVLGYLAKQAGSGASGGVVGSILGSILGGAAQGSAPAGGTSAGSIIGDLLGGLLGKGRR